MIGPHYWFLYEGQQMKSIKAHLVFWMCIVVTIIARPAMSQADEFGAMAIPTIMDADMDRYYKIPPDSGPRITAASSVYKGQMFHIFIVAGGYSTDTGDTLHVTYDFQLYDPQGNATDVEGTDLLVYQGPMGDPHAVLLSQEVLQIVFTDEDQFGTYKIKVTVHDKNSGSTFTSETPIKLVEFALPELFESQQEAGEWLMGYYKTPSPVQAISGVRSLVQPDPEWLTENLHIVTFFRSVFSDNPFLFKHIAKHFSSFSQEDQERFLIISALCEDSELQSFAVGPGKEEFNKLYQTAKTLTIPDLTDEIDSPVQLDMLWSEFLARGTYEPVRKIVSALELKKYTGALDKVKAREVEVTEELERHAYLEATYKSAIWSLSTNCRQMPLVHKYCAFMYKNEPLDEDIKRQLGSILRAVYEMLREKEAAEE
jgi:hypothetical protein